MIDTDETAREREANENKPTPEEIRQGAKELQLLAGIVLAMIVVILGILGRLP